MLLLLFAGDAQGGNRARLEATRPALGLLPVDALPAQGWIDLVTADNGNFWTDRAIELPVTTYASSCPDLTAMMTQSRAKALVFTARASCAILPVPQDVRVTLLDSRR